MNKSIKEDIKGISTGEVSHLLNVIRAIPGEKILTLLFWSGITIRAESHADGSLGCDGGHGLRFRVRLLRAMHEGGVLLIRSCDQVPHVALTQTGGLDGNPGTIVYVVDLGEGKWCPVEPDELENARINWSHDGYDIAIEPDETIADLRSLAGI